MGPVTVTVSPRCLGHRVGGPPWPAHVLVSPLQTALISVGCDLEKKIVIQKCVVRTGARRGGSGMQGGRRLVTIASRLLKSGDSILSTFISVYHINMINRSVIYTIRSSFSFWPPLLR